MPVFFYALLLPPIVGALIVLGVVVIACWDWLTGKTRREREAEQARLDADDLDRRFAEACRAWDTLAGEKAARIARGG